MNAIDIEKLADKILLKLRKKTGKLLAIDSLASAFKVDLGDLIAALKLLEQWGYKLEKGKRKEVALRSTPDLLTATEIEYGLKTKVIGRKVYAFHSVKSTNDIALELAESGEAEGAIVTAEEQTRGKGRLGRKWHSPREAGIYVSIILRPKFAPEFAPGLAIMTALALADTISPMCKGAVKIKWPNDIQISGRKAAGILTELSAEKGAIDYVVIGVGINANHVATDFPEELSSIATSLRLAARKKIHRVPLLQQFLLNFEKEYARYQKRQLEPSHKRIRKYSSLIGHTVTLAKGRRHIEALAVDIDRSGGLVIERDGHREVISSGEVRVVKDQV